MTGHAALVLGAGFSRPAGGPLLRELLSSRFMAQSSADEEVLEALGNLLLERREATGEEGATLEGVFTDIWREARTAGNVRISGEAWPAAALLSGLVIHLTSVCGAIRLRRSSRLWNTYIGFLSKVWDESRTLSVITFNYDALVEQLLDDIGLRYDYGGGDGIEFDDAGRRRRLRRSGRQLEVLKLHGSSNWGLCRGCRNAGKYVDQVTAFEKPYVPIRRRTCPRCGVRFLEAGIIPPILGKAGESRHMEPLWLRARTVLRRAREVMVIGYSLPAGDPEAHSLLREVETLVKRPRITVVCGFGGAPQTYEHLFKRFQDPKQGFEAFAEGFSD